ncbi:MAG: Glu-tRNA(Gln) amidotransferase subunit GatE [Bacteroidetes bacterium]|nr:Glu-tRNA(Gln) amidotransferase subunit GatE [Bacteroidota bacterium]
MNNNFDPKQNYEESKRKVGYVTRKLATQETYNSIGFMSGLEVHQQLLTKEKLFCHCPAGVFQKPNVYDAEVVRHMRPTLSELGEYDGTALMEFRTRKEIIYRVKNETTCTYDVDDTPPFLLNREALGIAIEISMLSKLSLVGEVHITRKQYLDGSIPAGFQRTAIIGVEGEIPLKNKKVRLIQLSIEEDSCREVSDIGHVRIYRTDRLGMPLIETVTYPDMLNPDEVMEACNYIRFLNRSTNKVRTGIGAGRQDVNVSCKGGTRVEIKGVSHTKWIPELTHNECFRQWALLQIREMLLHRIKNTAEWKMDVKELDFYALQFPCDAIKAAKNAGMKMYAVNLPEFRGVLSYFTQPGKMFANEISERLKVIACIDLPNMTHSEEFYALIAADDQDYIRNLFNTNDDDAQIIFWGPEADIKTAIETIEERCRMAFIGVPQETRKSFADGTTIFERVLPGADRMYPDTDSKPIPLEESYIDDLKKNVPTEVVSRYNQLKTWNIPEDTYTYIFKKNLFPLIEKIINDLKINPVKVGTFFGHYMKYVEGHHKKGREFNYEMIYDLLVYLLKNNYDLKLAKKMIPILYVHPKMDMESILISIKFKQHSKEEITKHIPFLKEKFAKIRYNDIKTNEINWIMGQLHHNALGNINLTELKTLVEIS